MVDIIMVAFVIGILGFFGIYFCKSWIKEDAPINNRNKSLVEALGYSCVFRQEDGAFYINLPQPQYLWDKGCLQSDDDLMCLYWSHNLCAGYGYLIKNLSDNLARFDQIPIDLVCSLLYAEQIWGGPTLQSMGIDKSKIMDSFNRVATEHQKQDVKEFSLFIRNNRLPFYYDGIETVG